MAAGADWQTAYASKVITEVDAASLVQLGQRIWMGIWASTPWAVCTALYARLPELPGLQIYHNTSPFQWVRHSEPRHDYQVYTAFATPADRQAVNEGSIEYIPQGLWRCGQLPPGFDIEYDIMFTRVSPPDRRGYCSFGTQLLFNNMVAPHARMIVAEVDESLIRTGGTNYISVDRIDYLVKGTSPPPPPLPPRSEEAIAVAEVAGTLIASELIRDRDTLHIGIGDISSALPLYLEGKRDLGVQTEFIPGGVANLVQKGVVTGRYKTWHPGKVVGSAFVQVDADEAAYLDGHPMFELYDFNYVVDPRYVFQQENFVAVNNALAVDLTGQVSADSIGTRVFSGPGGQPVFSMAASHSSGRSIIALPSSTVVNDERRSRILPVLEPGTGVTSLRYAVDYVVTEQGIATLRGKTLKERIAELISIAHPDFRGELRREASRLYPV